MTNETREKRSHLPISRTEALGREHVLHMAHQGGYELRMNPALVPQLPADHPTILEISDVFDLQRFSTPRSPIRIGSASLEDVPSPIHVHNMPIKFPHTEHRVPAELGYLQELLDTCASVEASINPHLDESYAYLTIQKGPVTAGKTQRTPSLHSDGLQGQRIQPKVRAEHGYLLVDSYPPCFFPQPFDLEGIDVDVHDVDVVFAQQVDEELAVQFEPNDLVLFDSYCLHRAIPATEGVVRGFFRLTYTHPSMKFDRGIKTVNGLFEEEYARHEWVFGEKEWPTLTDPPSRR